MHRIILKKPNEAQFAIKSDFKQKIADCLYVLYGLPIKESFIKTIHLNDNGATVNTWFDKTYYISENKLLFYFGFPKSEKVKLDEINEMMFQ